MTQNFAFRRFVVAVWLSALALPHAVADQSCQVVDGTIVCTTAQPDDPQASDQQRGLVVYSEVDSRNGATMGFGGQGYVDGASELLATVRERSGAEASRKVHMRFLEREGDADRRLMVIESPNDEEGVALLTISSPDGKDDQWTFNPDTKQVKRVRRNSTATPFLGLDITFEDLSLQNIDRYAYRFLRATQFRGHDAFVIERTPSYPHSGYSRLVTWVDQEHYYPLRTDYYAPNGELIKTLELFDYERYSDRFWRAGRMELVHHASGRQTTLIWQNYRFDLGLSAADFDINGLQRPRALR